MDPRVLCGLCLYCNSLMETVNGRKRTSVWTDILSPVYDWFFFRALDGFLLDFVGVRMLLFCKDDIITNRYVCICGGQNIMLSRQQLRGVLLHHSCRVSLERWRKRDRNVMVWTVNNDAEKHLFRERDIPFFTDSAIKETPEAWIPPGRQVTRFKAAWLVLPIVVALLIYTAL